MATDYKIVVVPDTGGTRPCIECPQCLGLQLLFIQWRHWLNMHNGSEASAPLVLDYCSVTCG